MVFFGKTCHAVLNHSKGIVPENRVRYYKQDADMRYAALDPEGVHTELFNEDTLNQDRG